MFYQASNAIIRQTMYLSSWKTYSPLTHTLLLTSKNTFNTTIWHISFSILDFQMHQILHSRKSRTILKLIIFTVSSSLHAQNPKYYMSYDSFSHVLERIFKTNQSFSWKHSGWVAHPECEMGLPAWWLFRFI